MLRDRLRGLVISMKKAFIDKVLIYMTWENLSS